MKIIEVPLTNGIEDSLGVKWGGKKILEFFKNIEFNEKGKNVFVDNLNISKIDLIGDLGKDFDVVYKNAFNSFQEKVFFLGGDHSASYPLTRAFFDYSEYNGKSPCLIIFDSEPNSHVAKNKKIPKYNEWLYSLIEDGFPTQNILIVGIRNSYSQEIKYLEEKGVRRILMNDLFLDLENYLDVITEFGYGKNVYVSINFSVIDPVFMPAVNFPSFGGLTSREFLYLVNRISKMKNLVAGDLVGFNVSKDINDFGVSLASKVLAELI